MGTIAFDTLAFVQAVERGGFSKQQAEALAEAQRVSLNQMLTSNDLATGKDIARLEKQMAEMESRLIKSFHNALFGFAGAIAGCIAIAVAVLK